MIFDPAMYGAESHSPYVLPVLSTWASASAWIPLIYDTVIFVLTMHRTIPELRSRDASFVIKRIFDDGLIYYSVIFSVNAILTVMILAAPAGIKNIAAQITQNRTTDDCCDDVAHNYQFEKGRTARGDILRALASAIRIDGGKYIGPSAIMLAKSMRNTGPFFM
ncbi:hypothetical protein DFJ43DRAFT_1150671 [Lentinula guzmanii]|uniref:Uncharacterized protein n=1 Tax=Lentinula guzmanii TaxID=2804957 RepID=A0AA38JUL7_9AGAR|nr:hypothetical protein DFJ43DRAFT_1150671 [Lentinula guzmanii]